MFILSIIFVISFVVFLKTISDLWGVWTDCKWWGVVWCCNEFCSLMVFLIYLGGILVVFCYTTALATEQYLEV